MPDIFGDLREWGAILHKIDRLTEAGELDEHQNGLVRLLRYRFNWQLRHKAIDAVAKLRTPSPEVMEALLRIAGDEYSELGTRVMACGAVECALRNRTKASWSAETMESIQTFCDGFLGCPQPPTLRQAVERWLALLPDPEQHPQTAGTC